jgi:hypothetical protein
MHYCVWESRVWPLGFYLFSLSPCLLFLRLPASCFFVSVLSFFSVQCLCLPALSSRSLSLNLPAWLFPCLPVSPSFLFICFFICLDVSLSTYLIFLSGYFPACMSFYLTVLFLYVSMSTCLLYICLSVFLFPCPCVRLFSLPVSFSF